MTTPPSSHRPRHRSVDEDDVATRMIPRVEIDADATAVMPKLPPAPNDTPTALIPKLTAPTPEETAPPAAGEEAPKGVKVVPLRPVRTEEGYRSVYSDLTRTTFGTVVRTVSRTTGELL